MVLCRAAFAKEIDRLTFPGMQGGPLVHMICGEGGVLCGGEGGFVP